MAFSTLSDRQKGLLAAITTAVSWSVLAILLKFALKYSDSYSIVWYRMTVAFVTLTCWMIFSGRKKQLNVLAIPPGLLLVAGLCLALNYLGFMQGIHYTSPAATQIFIQLGPLSLALSGLIFFKETLSRKQITGFFFCLVGFGLFFSDRLEIANQAGHLFYLGLAWIVMAALVWAAFSSIQKYLLRFWNSSQINLYVYLTSTVVFIPMVNFHGLLSLPWPVHLLLFILGLNTLLAYGCLSVALKHLPATQVSPILTMNPLLTLILIYILDMMNWNLIPPDPVGLMGYLGAVLAIYGIQKVLSGKARPKAS